MRRQSRKKTRDPDTEKIKKDREVALGDVRTAESQLLEIGETSKTLEENIEKRKKAAEEEIDAIIVTKQDDLDKLNKEIKRQEGIASETTESSKKLLEENKTLTTANEELKTENENSTKEKSDLADSIKKLGGEIRELNKILEDLKQDIIDARESKKVLLEKISGHEAFEKKLTEDIAAMEKKLGTLSSSLDQSTINKTAIGGNIFELNEEIKKGKAELLKVQTALETANKDLITSEETKKKFDAEMDEKIGNMAKLEKRVDDKIAIFEKYKDRFSVDELAKMKVSKDLV